MMHAVSFSALLSLLYTMPNMHGGWRGPHGSMVAPSWCVLMVLRRMQVGQTFL